MNLTGAAVLVVLISVIIGASRRVALLGMMAGVLYLTQGQAIEVLGFHFWAVRFLEVAGFVRVTARREFSSRQLNRIDKALILLYFYATAVFLLRGGAGQAAQVGTAVDALFSYFTFRGLLQELEDFRWFLRAFALLILPYASLVFMQSRTGHNPFALLGAADGISEIRHGRPRCDASFREADTLGMFAATYLPLFVGLALCPKSLKRALLAIGLCLFVAWASNSGGSAAAVAMGLVGWGLWPWRMEMRKVRLGILSAITGIALVMKVPIWYIFAHVSKVTGGDGWHRSQLIDLAYRHLGLWWLAGMPIADTRGWFPYLLPNYGTADITNQYISFGLMAGLGAIALFILLLVRAFSNIGKALVVARFNSQQPTENEFLLWGLGVMLTVHIADWFGITYFDQMYMVWFMQLAAVSSLTQRCLSGAPPLGLAAIGVAPAVRALHEANSDARTGVI